MNVGTLMENLEKSLSSLKEALLNRGQTFALLSSSNGVFNYLIEYWLVFINSFGILENSLGFEV